MMKTKAQPQCIGIFIENAAHDQLFFDLADNADDVQISFFYLPRW